MSTPHKKQKIEKTNHQTPDFEQMYQDILAISHQSEDHPYVPLLQTIRAKKNLILQVIQPLN